jgi:hypothetical protein
MARGVIAPGPGPLPHTGEQASRDRDQGQRRHDAGEKAPAVDGADRVAEGATIQPELLGLAARGVGSRQRSLVMVPTPESSPPTRNER